MLHKHSLGRGIHIYKMSVYWSWVWCFNDFSWVPLRLLYCCVLYYVLWKWVCSAFPFASYSALDWSWFNHSGILQWNAINRSICKCGLKWICAQGKTSILIIRCLSKYIVVLISQGAGSLHAGYVHVCFICVVETCCCWNSDVKWIIGANHCAALTDIHPQPAFFVQRMW